MANGSGNKGLSAGSWIALIVSVALAFASGAFALVGASYKGQVEQLVRSVNDLNIRLTALEKTVAVSERGWSMELKFLSDKILEFSALMRDHLTK